jgi:hypothetical protein
MAPDGIAEEALGDIDQEVVVTVRFTRGPFVPAHPTLREAR